MDLSNLILCEYFCKILYIESIPFQKKIIYVCMYIDFIDDNDDDNNPGTYLEVT